MCHLLIWFIQYAVCSYFWSVLLGDLKRFFSKSHNFFEAMGGQGFCNVKQKESDIRH